MKDVVDYLICWILDGDLERFRDDAIIQLAAKPLLKGRVASVRVSGHVMRSDPHSGQLVMLKYFPSHGYVKRNKPWASRLASIQELARMDILCSDETGTLTQNTITIELLATSGPTTQRMPWTRCVSCAVGS